METDVVWTDVWEFEFDLISNVIPLAICVVSSALSPPVSLK